MLKFIRTVDKRLEDFLILDFKALCNLVDDVNDHTPDTFRYGELSRVSCHFPEESSNGFVGGEPSCCSKYVVLHCSNCGTCNLGSEVAHLILPESEISLAVLEHDFQRPAHGVYAVCLLESKSRVGRNQGVPFGFLVSFSKEQPHLATGKPDINRDIVATKAAAVLASLLGMVKKSDECLCSIVLAVVAVLRLAHLNHAKVVALDVAGGDEPDNFSTGKPAVSKDIAYDGMNSTDENIIWIDLEDEVSQGIENTIIDLDINTPIYNIQGMQVDRSARGVLIQNGRKFIIVQ